MEELLIRIEDVLNGKYRFVEGQPVRRSYVDMENIGIENMKYKVGDRVKIKSLNWYNEHKDETDDIECSNNIWFYREMSKFCGKVMTISHVRADHYTMVEDLVGYWTDEMIECKVEEENKPKFKIGDEVRIKGTDIGGTVESIIRGQLIVNSKGSKIPAWPEDVVLMKSVEEETKPNIIEEAKTYWDSIKDAWICPEGYIFKDENGNVINATKIVLEKKKKEYPKTFEECVRVLEGENRMSLEQMNTFRKLIDARNAYWKIAGEEMGLGKPWEPDWMNLDQLKYCIWVDVGEFVTMTNVRGQHILAFPTEEMRDAFYENFKELIEMCKELL